MEYKVLYRKYRPTNFELLVGQDWTKKLLKNAIVKNKISHSYIFTGPRGTGKTSTARIFAKAINCEHPIDGNPCNKCAMCLNFNNNPDIVEIDAASNNGVEEVRELINNMRLAPSNSKYKVYIIDEFHMLSNSAFNALLLTLEEPPSNVVFILATTDIQSVPITIISRCQRFDFKPISVEDIVERLSFICSQENIKISTVAIKEIALLANGGMRDALGMLDQVSSQVDNITEDDVANIFGTISREKIAKLIKFIEDDDSSGLVNYMSELRKNGSNFNIVALKLIEYLKEIAIDIRENKYDGKLSFDMVYKLIFEINRCISESKNVFGGYDLLTVILLGCNYFPGNKITINSKLNADNKHDNIEKKVSIDVVKSDDLIENSEKMQESNKEIDDGFIANRVNNCFVAVKKKYLNNLLAKWSDFVIYESNANKVLMTYIADTVPVAASDCYCIVSNKTEMTNDLLNRNIESLEKDLSIFYGVSYKIVALSENKWNEYKRQYMENINKGYVYTMVEEKQLELDNKIENNDELINLANEIFGNKKYEVE